jgi:hypothetical protein
MSLGTHHGENDMAIQSSASDTYTSITIRAFDKAAAEKVADYIHGKTYFDFTAVATSYPCAGNDAVYISTKYPHGTEEERTAEVTEMVMDLLADMATGH